MKAATISQWLSWVDWKFILSYFKQNSESSSYSNWVIKKGVHTDVTASLSKLLRSLQWSRAMTHIAIVALNSNCLWWKQWSSTFFYAAPHLSSYLTYFCSSWCDRSLRVMPQRPLWWSSLDWGVLLICKLCQNYLTVLFIDQRENLSIKCHLAAPFSLSLCLSVCFSHVYFETYLCSKQFLASHEAFCTLHARD